MNAAGRLPRLGSLTGLRFFAALPVVLCHVGEQYTGSQTIQRAEYYGYTGVSFFFLLSGFVLTWSCATQSAPRFLWMRFSRVWPLQFVVAVFAMTVIAAQEHISGPAGKAFQLLLLQAWSPNPTIYFGGNDVTWSLSAEMFFYLMFPLVIIPLLRLRGRGLVITATATLSIMVVAPVIALRGGMSTDTFFWMFFVFPPYRFGEFLLGMLLARAVVLGLRMPRPAIGLVAAALGLVGVAAGLTLYTGDTGIYADRPFVAVMVLPFFGLLLLAGATTDITRGGNWLSTRPLLRLGEWSFALYLVHKPVYLLTRQWGWWLSAKHHGRLHELIYFGIFITAAVAVAAVAHYVVEKPVEQWLRRLATPRKPPAQQTAQQPDDPIRPPSAIDTDTDIDIDIEDADSAEAGAAYSDATGSRTD